MARVTLIATGGIQAPTQVALAKWFLADGHEVRCLASSNALRFLSGYFRRHPGDLAMYLRHYRPGLRETAAYYRPRPGRVPHVAEGCWPDVVVVAPATCNSTSKVAAGVTDTFPLITLRAVRRGTPVLLVPSMNPEMWFDPQLQRNVDILNATDKYQVLCPRRGEMLSGGVGFGAQVPLDTIVGATYRALGLLGAEAEALLAGQAPPGTAPNGVAGEPTAPDAGTADVVLVDQDVQLRQRLAAALRRARPGTRVREFAGSPEALVWLQNHRPTLVVTDLDFGGTSGGLDLVDYLRGPGGDPDVHIIALSSRSRGEIGAERLGRREVLFHPKPVDVEFLVGMVIGSIGGRRIVGVPRVRRRLRRSETLFNEGDLGSSVFVVESGQLTLSVTRSQGDVTLRRVGGGQVVGEFALLGGGRRSANAVAEVDTVLIELDLGDVRGYLDRQPAWLGAPLDSLCHHLLDATEDLVLAGVGERYLGADLKD
jgi:CheY-like chemotaxis protein